MRLESCKRSFGRELERSRMSLAPTWSCATEAPRDSCWVVDLQIACMRSLDGKLSSLLGGRSVGHYSQQQNCLDGRVVLSGRVALSGRVGPPDGGGRQLWDLKNLGACG